jgi:hypothetical protein
MAALPNTLRSITATKIVELQKQRDEFETTKAAVEASAKQRRELADAQSKSEDKTLESATALLEGISHSEGIRLAGRNSTVNEAKVSQQWASATTLRNQSRLLQHYQVDPNFPRSCVDDIHDDLTRSLELKSVRHAHALFFSELVTEWIGSDTSASASSSPVAESESSAFENVGRKEMHDQRREWESNVFGETEVDVEAVEEYLSNVFTNSKLTKQAYEALRTSTRTFSLTLADKQLFSTESVKVYIKGVLATDLLNEDKRAILKTFLANKEVLKEVADVLSMRFKTLKTWNWTLEKGAIPVEQRRQLNGKYRVYMDEDVLDAVFVHAIGIEWSVHWRSTFMTFYSSQAWQKGETVVPWREKKMREWYLGTGTRSNPSIHAQRQSDYSENYFMTQLPERIDSAPRSYDDSDSDDGEDALASDRKSPLEIKHSLLHLLVTEAMLARKLHPDSQHTVIRSDFKWFGPSLPHQSIFSVLKFFGVSDTWLNFFRKFLLTPVRFAQDGPRGAVHTRTRGVPMSHVLSDMLSEVVLFVMDFAVNSSTKCNQYRLHDDFWFWGPVDTCRTAWQQMHAFANTMGIEFNEEKTGSVVFNTSRSADHNEKDAVKIKGLPEGDVRWGFLKLDAETYRFQIDQSQVDEHIQELQRQFDATTSIFGYIQAYNSYVARFFSNNFGKPSFAFGVDHVDEMIQTLKRIHLALYPDGNVTKHLAKLAEARFGVLASSISQGFWYMPVSNGGTELRNPVISLMNMRGDFDLSPEQIIDSHYNLDVAEYAADKTRYEKKNNGNGLFRSSGDAEDYKHKAGLTGDEPFMSQSEYLKHREIYSRSMCTAYVTLLQVPKETEIEVTLELETLTGTLGRAKDNHKRGLRATWADNSAYWKWIIAVFGKEIVDRYGKLQMVDLAQVPLGVVSLMKAGKVRWQG